ncbi:MAG: hypothetical protein EB059_02755 [Alphaproteobacteria bacterium]|nr:hypothetical protein [Alphaproteobacteria bacterium]
MMKRFLSLIAILALTLVGACAEMQDNNPPLGTSAGKICHHSSSAECKKCCKKHHCRHHHVKKAAAPKAFAVEKKSAAPVAPTIPLETKDVKETKPGMFDGVKKIIKDVQGKDAK